MLFNIKRSLPSVKPIPAPSCQWNPGPGPDHEEAYKKAKYFSQMTGFLIVLDSDVLKRTLSYSLILHDIPALTLELGESYVINEENVEYGVNSIWNILIDLEMRQRSGEQFKYHLPQMIEGQVLRYTNQPLSSTSGITRFLAKPEEFVKKGNPLARIYNTFGKLEETIAATEDGIVLGHSDSSVAFPGTLVVACVFTEILISSGVKRRARLERKDLG